MKAERKSYLLRINEQLWNDLNEWAGQEFRSVNGQIELILRQAVNERKKGRRQPVNGNQSEIVGNSGDSEDADLSDIKGVER